MKYGVNNECVIIGLKCISKFGLCVYVKVDEVLCVFNGLGIVFVFIFKGVMIDKDVC